MRFAVDTGGTFTDLIIEDDEQGLHMFKASTTVEDPIRGVIDALQVAAGAFNTTLAELLGRGEMFIYGTTHALNAVLTGNTARTAFLTSAGHPDILVLREGGRADSFDFTVPYPQPYVPRALTWEVQGRMLADGRELHVLDEAALTADLAEMRNQKVAAVGVCLLWSISNPAHELRVGALIEEYLPGVPYTLSHQLNPTLREYRRASATCIDASLKPMMAAYLDNLAQRLAGAGFTGRTLVVTSQGGVMDAKDAAMAPIYMLNSGPSMAPVSGRYFADVDEAADTAIIADTGGTTYDVSVVRRGAIPWTREAWIGQPYRGHMTGFPSVDVTSVGAGGGSLAWVDDGGMLHVGPQSAGAQPGPACYGRGGVHATVTDACVVLGYVDPDYFLGGAMRLSSDAAREALRQDVADPLGISIEAAADAVLELATENMVQAILEICINQGIDPGRAVLIGGGGAGGLNSVRIARRLRSPRLLIPEVGAALSAAGAMMSDLNARFQTMLFARSDSFDAPRVNLVLAGLAERCDAFIAGAGQHAQQQETRFWAEARYPDQVWEIDTALEGKRFDVVGASASDSTSIEAAVQGFHQAHEALFAVHDPLAPVEFIGWSATVACRIRGDAGCSLAPSRLAAGRQRPLTRRAYFAGYGWVDAAVHKFEILPVDLDIDGPALIESSFTTVVIEPGARACRRASGSLAITPEILLAAGVGASA